MLVKLLSVNLGTSVVDLDTLRADEMREFWDVVREVWEGR